MLILLINVMVVWALDVGRNLFLGRRRIYAQLDE